MTDEQAIEHAKALKEYCSDRDNLDEPCEDCPFLFYDYFGGNCVLSTTGYIRINGSILRKGAIMNKKRKIADFTNFMRWLWNNDRETYTLIMLGHTELITKELMDKYRAERGDKE